jgi:hypothetical protein
VIAKYRPRAQSRGDFVLFSGERRLAQTRSLEDLLARLRAILESERR